MYVCVCVRLFGMLVLLTGLQPRWNKQHSKRNGIGSLVYVQQFSYFFLTSLFIYIYTRKQSHADNYHCSYKVLGEGERERRTTRSGDRKELNEYEARSPGSQPLLCLLQLERFSIFLSHLLWSFCVQKKSLQDNLFTTQGAVFSTEQKFQRAM